MLDTPHSKELLSGSLARIFRGKLCAILLQNRPVTVFEKTVVLYDIGEQERKFFFIQRGVVSVGTITVDGREIIYDVRKTGEVIGELCASEMPRRDRAIALERTEVIAVAYEEVLDALQKNRAALQEVLRVFCRALSNAYEQTDTLFDRDTGHRLAKALLKLGTQLGRQAGDLLEIDAYLTQEEVSQMIGLSREKVSTALNVLRTRNMVQYTRGGHLLLDVKALSEYDKDSSLASASWATLPERQRRH